MKQRFQGHGSGRLLLRAVLELAQELRYRVGCLGVVIEAKSNAELVYSPSGSEAVDVVIDQPAPIIMFSPISQIAVAAEGVTN